MYIIDTNRDSNLIIELTQNDNNTGNIEFQILKDGKPLNITSKKVKLALVKNTTNKGDIITNVNITNPTNGIVSVPITTLITGKKGLFVCGLAVYNGDYLENTGNFRLNVKRDIFENTAEVIIKGSVYSELLKMLETSNKTITEYQQKINNSIDNFNSTKVETLKNFKSEKDKVITEFKAEGKTEADNRRKEWDSLKKIAIKENNAVELQSQINVLDKALKSNQSLKYEGENTTCNDTLASRTESFQILGNTKYKREDESLTDVWEEGVSLESAGEKEKNLIKVNSCGKNLAKPIGGSGESSGIKWRFEGETLILNGKANARVDVYYTKYNDIIKCDDYDFLYLYAESGEGYVTAFIKTNKSGEVTYPTFNEGEHKIDAKDFKNIKNLRLHIQEGTSFENTKIKLALQVREGYEPYKEDTKQIQLPHPLRKVGDVADRIYEKDGKVWLEQNIKELKLNEVKSWLVGGKNELSTELFYTKRIEEMVTNGKVLCDRFKQIRGLYLDEEGIYIDNGINIRIDKSKGIERTQEAFKKWLSENPTIVLYQLKTPIVTELNIKNIDLDTFSPITHITSDNNIQPTLDFKVPSNLASIVQANSRAINEIYDLIDTLITPQLIQNRLDIDINKFKK